MHRRPLLQALALSPLASAFSTSAQTRQQGRPAVGYGPLRPVADEAAGLPLLMLPEGFSHRSFGWAGEALANGGVVPGAADGMGIVKSEGEVFTPVRNHEIFGTGGVFGPAARH